MTARPITERLTAYNSGTAPDRVAVLSWHREDPLTVSLWFPRQGDAPASMWMLDRDMCLLALAAQAGFPGAVRLEPVTAGLMRFLRVTLWGAGTWDLRLTTVAGFLARTEDQAPARRGAIAASNPLPDYDWDAWTKACWKTRRAS